MSDLYLIRHGQASFGKINYDQLSELGHQQAELLGQYLKRQKIQPDKIILGTLQRHKETAQGLCKGLAQDIEFEFDAGWNEFDFHSILRNFINQFPEHAISEKPDPKLYFGLLRKALLSWSDGTLKGPLPESWESFENRVRNSLHAIKQSTKGTKILAVTSGGAIAMALKHILAYPNETLIDMNLQSKNTGLSHCYFSEKNIYLTSFNNVPHLDHPDRHHMVTSA